MFWKRKDNDPKSVKLPGPRAIPEIVKKQIIPAMIDPAIMPFLMILTKNSETSPKSNDFYIFDPADAEARAIRVLNYESLSGNDELIIADGSYDEQAKTAFVNLKRNIPIFKCFTPAEIQQQIEQLKTPDEQVFFYTAAGGGVGGPLGRGAAVIKLNPTDGPKKRKKYGIHSVRVINMQPIFTKDSLVFDSDQPKEIAKWISECHKARFC
jgi:hypothetical protein